MNFLAVWRPVHKITDNLSAGVFQCGLHRSLGVKDCPKVLSRPSPAPAGLDRPQIEDFSQFPKSADVALGFDFLDNAPNLAGELTSTGGTARN